MAQCVSIKIEENNISGALRDFLQGILKNGSVSALFVPRALPSGGMVVPTLITDPEDTGGVNPLAPVMPLNAATELAKLTRTLSGRTIAAVLRPCEVRAYIELVKLNQGARGNCVLITADCFGTLAAGDYADRIRTAETPENFSNVFVSDAIRNKDDLPLRKACTICNYPEALPADIHVRIAGSPDHGAIYLEGLTGTGREILGTSGFEEASLPDTFLSVLGELREARSSRRTELLAEVAGANSDLSTLMATLERCINCKNCRDVCPVCYCRECVFDTPLFEHDSELYMSWAERKSSIRMPSETLFFHLTRMNHMGVLCVGCGMCTEACPNDVPVADLFQLAGERVQKIFDYIPGKDPDEEIPLTVFREEELEPR